MSNQFTFTTLTPDMTLDALESVSLRPESGLLCLNSYENRVYQFQDENRKRWVVKFYRPERWTKTQIMEEHQFSFKLQEADIPIVAPVKINGNSLFHHQDFHFAIFPYMGGRSFEVDNELQLETVAHYLAKIHNIGQHALFEHRPTIDLNEYLTQSSFILEQCLLIPKQLTYRFFNVLGALIKQITQYWQRNWQSIALHGDCHPSNILWRDEPVFVDLDDARNGPAIQDIWMLLNGENKEKQYQLNIIAEAYNQFANFPSEQLKLIEPLRGLRIIYYAAWIAKRWQDPAFPLAFPWFAEEKYWEDQILTLEKQIEIIEQPPLSLYPQW